MAEAGLFIIGQKARNVVITLVTRMRTHVIRVWVVFGYIRLYDFVLFGLEGIPKHGIQYIEEDPGLTVTLFF